MKFDNNGSSSTSILDGTFDAASNFSLEFGISLIVFGILCGFFGKKLVKPVSFLTGFIVGAGLSLTLIVIQSRNSALAAMFHSLNFLKVVVISAAGGTIMGLLMFAFYKLIIYGILGGFVSFIATMVTWEFSEKAQILQYPVATFSFLIGTFLSSLLPTFSTIVVTSGLGSYLLTVGIDCILKSGFNHIFAFGFGYKWSQVSVKTTDEIFGLLAFWIILFLWMGIRQLFSKARTNEKDGKFKVKNNQINSKEFLVNSV